MHKNLTRQLLAVRLLAAIGGTALIARFVFDTDMTGFLQLLGVTALVLVAMELFDRFFLRSKSTTH